MTTPRLVLAGVMGLVACTPSPEFGSKAAPVSVVDGDPNTAPDNNAHPQVVGVEQFVAGRNCTGTIIASNKVLTAAHCINTGFPITTVEVRLDLNTTTELQTSLAALADPAIRWTSDDRLIWTVASIAPHPAYSNDQDTDVDLAVLTMTSSIPPSLIEPMPIVPAILPSPFLTGMTGYDRWIAYGAEHIGMGKSGPNCTTGAFSPATRLLLEVVDTKLGSKGGIEITWLGTTPSGSGICEGDSGGPFVTIDADFIGSSNIPQDHLLTLVSGERVQNGSYISGPLIVGSNRVFVAEQALDADNDGIEVPFDTCDKQANPDQATHDTDGDGWPDVNCDDDDDNDGIPDITDNCDLVSNLGQADIDNDLLGDACDTDDDGDMVSDGTDNCPVIANPYQENCNADAERLGFSGSNPAIVLGDACDPVPCAPARTQTRDFIAHDTETRPSGQAICTTSTGRIYEDFIDILGRVKAGNAPISTTKLEAWFCGCEADTLAECKVAPWNCALSPTAGTATGSRWRKLTLKTTANANVSQPLSATFSPWNALPNPTVYRWDYQTDKASWIDSQHLWTPTANDPAIYGPGTDMQGVLWVRDPSSVGLSAHGSTCSGSSCSMASSYLTQVAPDRAVTLSGCNAIPRLAPARWWSFCAQCGDKFQLPWESLYEPGFVSVLDAQVRVFTNRLDRLTSILPGSSTQATDHFGRTLVDAMTNANVVGPSDSIEKLAPGRARAVAISNDGTKLLGEVYAGAKQFELRSLSSSQGVSARTGFAVAYNLGDAALRIAGGTTATGAQRTDYWRWTRTTGWRQLPIDTHFVPSAAVSTVFGGDAALYVIDRATSGIRLVRLDEKTGTGAQATFSLLSHATDAALFVLADGGVALATTSGNRTQLSRLIWKAGGLYIVKTHELVGVLAGAPSVAGRNLAVPLRVTTARTSGVKTEFVPASRL